MEKSMFMKAQEVADTLGMSKSGSAFFVYNKTPR